VLVRVGVRLALFVTSLLSFGLAACTSSGAPPAGRAPAAAPNTAAVLVRSPYRAVVTIVVDQLAAWVLSERVDALPADGGFRRLRREGTYVVELRYDYAITETAPGHAALYTGASPRDSGIIGNELAGASGEPLPSVFDGNASLVGAGGVLERPGASLARLSSETLADVLRRERPDAAIISLSLKDRGAVFGGGRKPDASVWLDAESGAFVTSTAFGTKLASFALRARPEVPVTWAPLDSAFVTSHARTPDAQDGEADVEGLGTTFPHVAATLAARRLTPFASVDLFALAHAALAGANPRDDVMLLALSVSSNDFVGHAYGPDSWEAWDSLHRIDAELAGLFTALDRRFGANGYAVLLSGDHGIVPLPEVTLAGAVRPGCAGHVDRWERPCGESGRVMMAGVLERAEAELARELGTGPYLRGYVDPYLHFTSAALALPPERRTKLVDIVTKALLRETGIARVVDVRSLPETCPAGEGIDALVCRSVSPGKGGELYLVPKRGFFLVSKARPRGTSHGSPYLYDRSVPLLVRAPGRVAAERRVDEPLDFRAFPRTAATLLGIASPASARPGEDLARAGKNP
jgi:hypothetical protein